MCGWWPPSQEQEKECPTTTHSQPAQTPAAQRHTSQCSDGDTLTGAWLPPPLLTNIKRKVVELATHSNVLDTIQTSAQRVLESAWTILLPTADERARALSNLLPRQSSESPQQ